MERATATPTPHEPVLGSDPSSPWAIVEIAPDALPAPEDGYVDLFEGEPDEGSGAEAPPAPGNPAAEPPPSQAERLATRAPLAVIAPPRLASPETLVVVLFLAAGGAIGALAHGRAAALAAPPAPAPLVGRGALRADPDPAGLAAARPAATRRWAAAARGREPGARAESRPLPAAPAPEPGPVRDPAADARDVPAPALASTAQRVATALSERASPGRARLADPSCLSGLRLPGAAAVDRAKVRVVVEPDGSASSIEVLSGTTDAAVADAIRVAASACRFVPASDAAGSPVRVDHVLAIDFAR